ncbi:MAG: PEGA domain-containing protein [bacterium]
MKVSSISVTAIVFVLLLLSISGCVSQPAEQSVSTTATEEEAEVRQDQRSQVKKYSRSEGLPPFNLEPKTGEVIFSTVPSGAEVVLNGRLVGRSPLRYALSDGTYNVRVQKERYHPNNFYLDIQNDNLAAVQIELEPFTGKIVPRIHPQDAEVLLRGVPVEEFPLELPVGTYRLQVQRFGYKPLSRTIEVKRSETSRPQFILEPAPFDLETVSLQAKRLRRIPPLTDPRLLLTGTVSGPGTVEVEIKDSSDVLVDSKQIILNAEPEFRAAFKLGEGKYTVTIRAKGKRERATVLLKKKVEVVSENTIAIFSTGTPSSGVPVGVPRSQSLPSGVLQGGLSFSAGGPAGSSAAQIPEQFPAQLSLAAGLPYAFELQGSASFFIQREEYSDWAGTAQIKKEIASGGNSLEWAGALQLLGTYQPGFESGIGAGPILELRYVPEPEYLLGIGFSPTVHWMFRMENERNWRGLLQGGIFVQRGRWAYSFSSKTDTDFEQLWYAVEISRLILGTSMHINFSAGAVAGDNFIDYYTGGFGFYYIR